jgi:hypothetical protein
VLVPSHSSWASFTFLNRRGKFASTL